MELKWLGHSCFRITQDGYSIVIDPFEPGSVPGLSDIHETANAVLCTHDHHDHNWMQGVTLTDGGESPFTIDALETFHDPQGGALRGRNTIYILSHGGVRIAHLGDLGCELSDEQVKSLGRLDAVLCPVGGFYTIDARQAYELVRRLDVGVVVPMHYRSESFGFDVIGPVEDFTSLFPASQVEAAESDAVSISGGEGFRVVVLRYDSGA